MANRCCTVSAEALPLVLVHSQLLTAELWRAVRPAFETRGPVHCADVTRDETIEGMAGRLLADAPERFDLVALGMGGFVAFAALRKAPGRIRRLVLVSTLPEADSDAQTRRRAGYSAMVERGEFDAVAEERIPLLLGREARDGDIAAAVREMARAVGPEAFLRQQSAIMARPDSTPMLAGIVQPTLVLRGEEDGIMSDAHFEILSGTIPNARGFVVPHSGHLIPLERPEAFADAVITWLDRKDRV